MADKGPRALPFETPHAEIRRLRAENARLRQLLIAHDIAIPPLGRVDRPCRHPFVLGCTLADAYRNNSCA